MFQKFTKHSETVRLAPYLVAQFFVLQFHDLHTKRPQIRFLVDPFNFETDCLKTPLVSDEAASELEMIDLCEEGQLKPA